MKEIELSATSFPPGGFFCCAIFCEMACCTDLLLWHNMILLIISTNDFKGVAIKLRNGVLNTFDLYESYIFGKCCKRCLTMRNWKYR